MIKSKWKMFIVMLDTSYVLLLDTRNPGVSNVLFPVVPWHKGNSKPEMRNINAFLFYIKKDTGYWTATQSRQLLCCIHDLNLVLCYYNLF